MLCSALCKDNFIDSLVQSLVQGAPGLCRRWPVGQRFVEVLQPTKTDHSVTGRRDSWGKPSTRRFWIAWRHFVAFHMLLGQGCGMDASELLAVGNGHTAAPKAEEDRRLPFFVSACTIHQQKGSFSQRCQRGTSKESARKLRASHVSLHRRYLVFLA